MTTVLLVAVAAILIAYDVWAYVTGKADTISVVIRRVARNQIVPFLAGMLAGHWFWTGVLLVALVGCGGVKPPDVGCLFSGCPEGFRCLPNSEPDPIKPPPLYVCQPDPTPTPSPSPSSSPSPSDGGSPSPTPLPSPTSTPTPPPASPTPEPTPTPSPAPTPSPDDPQIDPITGNYPTPPAGVCPAHFANSFDVMGVSFRSKVPVPTNSGVYLGLRFNFDATPKSKRPYCGHVGDRFNCEQWSPCQDRRGADFYMWLPGKFSGDRCDLASSDVGGDGFWCHHKPRVDETGPTTVCAVPVGSRQPTSPEDVTTLRGKCVKVDIR